MNPNLVYLCQSDTTAGLISQDAVRLAEVKSRPAFKSFLRACDSFLSAREFGRMPKAHRKFMRHAEKTSFALPSKHAIRIVAKGFHHRHVKNFGWVFTTSANRSGESFDLESAVDLCDVLILDQRGLSSRPPSRLIKLGKHTRKVLRK